MNQKKLYTKLLLVAFIFLNLQSFAQVTQATMNQIQLLLNEKNNRTPIERKIHSRLLQAIRESRGEKMAANINLDKANVNADAFGKLKVDISANITTALLSKLIALGGKIIYASPKYNTLRATVNFKSVETIAGYAEVKFIQPAIKYMLEDGDINELDKQNTLADRIATVRAKLTVYLKSVHPLAGNVTSEGDATHRADDVRTDYAFQGQGIKIGVLSDSYDAKGGAAANVASGDLPGVGNPEGDLTPVTVLADYSGGSDEGRAILQVIHDLAPKAQLFFATADLGEASFADNIQTLRDSFGCNVIVDDVFYFDEPVFQDGIVAQAVNIVTASGALYFASAGNAGSVAKGTAGVFEGDFNDAGSLAFTGSSKPGTIHNFGTISSPVNGDIVKSKGLVYNMNWSDPWSASSNDYDLFLISSSGAVKGSSTNIQSGAENPYEQISAPNLVNGDRLVVFKTSAAAVRAFHVNTNRGTLTVVTGGQTKGHSCSLNAFATAATPAHNAFQAGAPKGPYPNPFVSTNKVENFSSDGPRRKFYNPDGTAITPGNFLFGTNGGTLLAKPDITAADGVKTTFSALSGLNPFFGTSCAAPHAAAIAALILSGNPTLTTTQVRTILTSTALDIEGAGYDYNSGYGILQAYQAAGAVPPLSCNSTYDGTTHNTFATAVAIPFNTDIHGTISTGTDVDFYKFTITTKGTATVTLSTLPSNYDLYIYKADQTQIAASKKGGTTNEVISRTFAKGTFYVKVIGHTASNFNNTDCYTLNVTLGTATKKAEDTKADVIAKSRITLFPNPASSVLNITVPKYEAGMNINVADVYGKTILSQQITSASIQLSLQKLIAGSYQVNLINKNGTIVETSKFVKQ